jgi:hypothetical protein
MADKMIFNIEEVSDTYIETFALEFVEKNASTINTLSFSLYKDNSKLSRDAFNKIVFDEIKIALYSFSNNENNPEYVETYLFAVIHKLIKGMNNEGKHNVYICPGCKYLSKLEILETTTTKLICNTCKNALNSAKYKWEEKLYNTFSIHNRKGFYCNGCENFIPDTGKSLISCPYPNCIFVGKVLDLKFMRHPNIKAKMEIPILTEAYSDNKSSDTELVVKDDINQYINVLNECIDSQIKSLQYKGYNSTIVIKLCMYDAFKNMVGKFPNEMISSLVLLNRNTKLQHKIFQEFVKLLEEKIPFSYSRNGNKYLIKSLLDENLCVFEGISIFNATVNDKLIIPNLTEELYVGGRNAYHCRPFYIGKILDIKDENGNDITSQIKEYDFFRIYMSDRVNIGTNVVVRHYSIKPHYSIGAMSYLNRIRRAIVDRVYHILHGEKRPMK